MKERLEKMLEEYRNGEREFPTYQDLAELLEEGVSAAPHEPSEQA